MKGFEKRQQLEEWLCDRTFIVCHDHSFVYMKATRTGGTSMFQGAMQRKMLLDLRTRSENEKELEVWRKNVTLEQWDKYFKFAFVRNPWDRLVSIYTYAVKLRGIDVSFRDFVLNICDFDSDPFIVRHREPCSLYTHFDGEQVIDFVGRYENLQIDFSKMCKMIGVDSVTLPHISKTGHDHYVDYYDEETKVVVCEEYRGDVENYGYEFGD